MIVETASWRANEGWRPAMPAPDGPGSLVLVFADAAVAAHPDRPLSELAAAWDGHAVLGCSTGGQVHGAELLDATLVATVVRFATTTVRAAHVEVARAGGSRRAGRELAERLDDPSLAAVLVVADGLTVNGSALLTGIGDVAGSVPVFGGLAADGQRFDWTWTLVGTETVGNHASAVGFYGDDLELGFGAGSGWRPFGPERLVTSSFGHVLHELDGRPAATVYHDYLGDRAGDLPGAAMFFPLELRDLDDRTVLRTPVGVDPDSASLSFAGDVPQGAGARLLRASTADLAHGATLAAKEAHLGGDELALAVSCCGRRHLMGERTEDELDAVAAALDPGTPLVGFYAYGALSAADGQLQNQTMTITTMRERSEGSR